VASLREESVSGVIPTLILSAYPIRTTKHARRSRAGSDKSPQPLYGRPPEGGLARDNLLPFATNLRSPNLNEHTTCQLIDALKPWMMEAIEKTRSHPEQWAQVVKCMNGNGDVRIVVYARENAITVEAANYDEDTVVEVFRQLVAPNESALSVSKSDAEQ
jgi:hypothetical protein